MRILDVVFRAACILTIFLFSISIGSGHIQFTKSGIDFGSSHRASRTVEIIPAAITGHPLGPNRTLGGAAEDCALTRTHCDLYLVSLINQARQSAGVTPINLNRDMSHGTASCLGARLNAAGMASDGYISHRRFDGDVCGPYPHGENVGYASFPYTKAQAIRVVFDGMMSEPHDGSTCAVYVNHACNILSPSFQEIGVSTVRGNGFYIAEEFAG